MSLQQGVWHLPHQGHVSHKRFMDPVPRGHRPEGTARCDAPRVHASCTAEWKEWVHEWDAWFTRYELASMRLRRGIAEALREFPEGSFVPTGVYPLGYDGKPPPALVS